MHSEKCALRQFWQLMYFANLDGIGWPITSMVFKRRNMQLLHCNMTLCLMVDFLFYGGGGEEREGRTEVCVHAYVYAGACAHRHFTSGLIGDV